MESNLQMKSVNTLFIIPPKRVNFRVKHYPFSMCLQWRCDYRTPLLRHGQGHCKAIRSSSHSTILLLAPSQNTISSQSLDSVTPLFSQPWNRPTSIPISPLASIHFLPSFPLRTLHLGVDWGLRICSKYTV